VKTNIPKTTIAIKKRLYSNIFLCVCVCVLDRLHVPVEVVDGLVPHVPSKPTPHKRLLEVDRKIEMKINTKPELREKEERDANEKDVGRRDEAAPVDAANSTNPTSIE
jgi:hypothetical protein